MLGKKLRDLVKKSGLVVVSLVLCGLVIAACVPSNEATTPEAQVPATNEQAAAGGQPLAGGQPSAGYPAPGSEGQPPAGGQPSSNSPAPGSEGQPPAGGQPSSGYPAPGTEGQPSTGGQPGSPGNPPGGEGSSARKRPDVGGQVTAVEGNIIRVENPRDGAVTIMTDANTQFRLMGETPGSLSDVAVGKFVGASGEMQGDGTILAALVIVSDAPPDGGPGQGAGPGSSSGQRPGTGQ